MATVHLEGNAIKDWPSFHRECQVKFGFPDFYGRTMDAWIDCLSTLRDHDGMSAFHLTPGESLQVVLEHSAVLQRTAPQILDTLLECIEAVNERYTESGEKPALELRLC